MEVHINEIVSSIRAVDHQQLLSTPLLERLVQEVMRSIDDRDGHRRRVDAERRVTSGVRDELESEI